MQSPHGFILSSNLQQRNIYIFLLWCTRQVVPKDWPQPYLRIGISPREVSWSDVVKIMIDNLRITSNRKKICPRTDALRGSEGLCMLLQKDKASK